MPDELPELENECFFIAPIGREGSDVRKRSDGVMQFIVAEAAEEVGLVTIRADKIAKPGEITRQVIEHVVGAKAAVVDLTGANPNVYYEMAVRHTAQLPTVLIAERGEVLPFDISQMRTIFFDHKDLQSAHECRDQIVSHLKEALNGEVESPISASAAVQRLEEGSPQDRVLAQIIEGIDDLRRRLGKIERSYRTARIAKGIQPPPRRAIEVITDDMVTRARSLGASRPSTSETIDLLEARIAQLKAMQAEDMAESRSHDEESAVGDGGASEAEAAVAREAAANAEHIDALNAERLAELEAEDERDG